MKLKMKGCTAGSKLFSIVLDYVVTKYQSVCLYGLQCGDSQSKSLDHRNSEELGTRSLRKHHPCSKYTATPSEDLINVSKREVGRQSDSIRMFTVYNSAARASIWRL